ncbi:glycogen synthase GlgA [Gallaecimonas kandeliae]|uniref:glycogen synthase GlgA n=1 Tax=Gallaecimonas kandeliae TaxID=3029055 RepID=UPI0026487E80|nr:glycogen synthase GlgA [Gallaecimonas kandeliae]WKE64817.1 glycogen synthase GlgA [Gallaecimonas kandeliae]
MRILFASSEAYPLVKTGGLADVSGSLPRALQHRGHDVRLLLPAYRQVLAKAPTPRPIATLKLGRHEVALLESRLPGSKVKTWLLHCPALYDRPGDPYHDQHHQPWPDNGERFLTLCQAAALLATDEAGLAWRPEILHCNDWQTGLAPAMLAGRQDRPGCLFTIHNLAYQGLFGFEHFLQTGLPPEYWSYEALEFHGWFSYIKGGIVFADLVNTVSPTYAAEIQTPEFGCGLDGLLRHRRQALCGILNGIDDHWNPGTDPHLARRYNSRDLDAKAQNKAALQQELGLAQAPDLPLLGFIGRLAEQKGLDLLLAALPALLTRPLQLVMLGSGEPHYQQALKAIAREHPQHFRFEQGYDEALAHRIEAGADLFLMPSLFEPCGLNQLYSLRYGTLPLVHRVGGLADTVFEEGPEANGFCFTEATPQALLAALDRALGRYRQAGHWRALQLKAMARDSSWRQSAKHYEALYQAILAGCR